jgi:heptosyltransferase-2
MRELVVMCPNLIGDCVMATPFLRALRAGYPDARIHALVKPVVKSVLEGLPLVDEIIPFDPKSKDPRVGTESVVSHLRELSPETMVLLPNSFRSALIAWKAGAKARIGYRRGGRGFLLTGGPKPPNRVWGGYRPMPAVEYYLGLSRYLGCPDMGVHLEQSTTESDEAAADEFFAAAGLMSEKPLIVFNTGGAFGPAKNWPTEYFAELATGLLRQIPTAQIVVICGPAEAENARRIVALTADNRAVTPADRPLSVGLSKAIVRRAKLMVTTDSGPRHFATAFGIPTIGLFGPTHIEWTRTMHPGAVHLQKQVPCGPCQKGVCPLKHHRCMRELVPDKVLMACLEQLGRKDFEADTSLVTVRPYGRRMRIAATRP